MYLSWLVPTRNSKLLKLRNVACLNIFHGKINIATTVRIIIIFIDVFPLSNLIKQISTRVAFRLSIVRRFIQKILLFSLSSYSTVSLGVSSAYLMLSTLYSSSLSLSGMFRHWKSVGVCIFRMPALFWAESFSRINCCSSTITETTWGLYCNSDGRYRPNQHTVSNSKFPFSYIGCQPSLPYYLTYNWWREEFDTYVSKVIWAKV